MTPKLVGMPPSTPSPLVANTLLTTKTVPSPYTVIIVYIGARIEVNLNLIPQNPKGSSPWKGIPPLGVQYIT